MNKKTAIDTIIDLYSIGPSDGLCQNCKKRPGAEKYVGEGGTLAYSRGWFQNWCKLCVLEAQLIHARERSDAIPSIIAEINELKATKA